MTRTKTACFIAVCGLLAAIAIAADRTETIDGDFGAGTTYNATVSGGSVAVTSVTNTDSTGAWYRSRWDGAVFEATLEKDDGTWFDGSDVCVDEDASISGTTDGTLVVNGRTYRTGNFVYDAGGGAFHEATVASGTALTIPSTVTIVDEVRFLTSGAHDASGSSADYTVTFDYDNGASEIVVVTVPSDDETGWTTNDGGDHTVNEWTGAPASACSGVATGAEIVIPNPAFTSALVAVTLTYDDTSGSGPWLGGPLAVTLLTTANDYRWTFDTARGRYLSTSDTSTIVFDAGANAVWHQLAWDETLPGGTTSGI